MEAVERGVRDAKGEDCFGGDVFGGLRAEDRREGTKAFLEKRRRSCGDVTEGIYQRAMRDTEVTEERMKKGRLRAG